MRRSDGPPEVRRRSRRSNTAPARHAALRCEGPHPGDQPAQRTPRHRRRAGRRPPVRGLATGALVNACARLRPNPDSGEVAAAAKRALRVLARRYGALSGEISELDTEIARLCAQANPALLAARGVGPDVAATLLIAAGDNPERLTSEASFAALCGASPVEASSGRTVRHRLNRGGDRQANNALWRIAMVRLRCDERTKAYAARRTAQGKSRREIIRCLKRYIAREIHQLLTDPPAVPARRTPTPPPTQRRRHHRRRRTSHQRPHQPPLRTRTRHPPQPRPRHPLPQLAHPNRRLTN